MRFTCDIHPVGVVLRKDIINIITNHYVATRLQEKVLITQGNVLPPKNELYLLIDAIYKYTNLITLNLQAIPIRVIWDY